MSSPYDSEVLGFELGILRKIGDVPYITTFRDTYPIAAGLKCIVAQTLRDGAPMIFVRRPAGCWLVLPVELAFQPNCRPVWAGTVIIRSCMAEDTVGMRTVVSAPTLNGKVVKAFMNDANWGYPVIEPMPEKPIFWFASHETFYHSSLPYDIVIQAKTIQAAHRMLQEVFSHPIFPVWESQEWHITGHTGSVLPTEENEVKPEQAEPASTEAKEQP
jgi:hypothetical protein